MNSDHLVKSDRPPQNLQPINIENEKYVEHLRKKQEKLQRENQFQTQSHTSRGSLINDSIETENQVTLEDEQKLLSIHDPALANIFLKEIDGKHDVEDLTYRFLDGHSLDQGKENPDLHNYLNDDLDAIDYGVLSSKLISKLYESHTTNLLTSYSYVASIGHQRNVTNSNNSQEVTAASGVRNNSQL